MDFISAIKSGFSNYATFAGRARRSEYWLWQLFTFLTGLAFGMLSLADGVDVNGEPETGLFTALAGIASLALALPSLAMLVRRLHDVGKSAWHIVYWGVIPVLVGFPIAVAGMAILFSQALMGSGPEGGQVGLSLVLLGISGLVMVGAGTVLFVFTLMDSAPANQYGPRQK